MTEEDRCSTEAVDRQRVERAAAVLYEGGTYADVSAVFRALGDPTRVKILHAVSACELCVCDISALLGMSASAVSHHLRTLRMLRLVERRREGKKAYYSLKDEHVAALVTQILEHVRH